MFLYNPVGDATIMHLAEFGRLGNIIGALCGDRSLSRSINVPLGCPRCAACVEALAKIERGESTDAAWHRQSSEAEKYTTGMWQRHLSSVVSLSWQSEAQRRGFRDGFNGAAWPHHWRVRDSFALGRQSALLLGYEVPR